LAVSAGKGSVYPHSQIPVEVRGSAVAAISVTGERPAAMLQGLCTGNVLKIAVGQSAPQFMLDADSRLISDVVVKRGADGFTVFCRADERAALTDWLRGISDGYLIFDREDIMKKVEGPAIVVELEDAKADAAISGALAKSTFKPGMPSAELYKAAPDRFDLTKTYFVGQKALAGLAKPAAKTEFCWNEGEDVLKRSCLYEIHKKTAKKVIPFAGWEMPVWYSSIVEEHRAVREAAGLFDVSHMGCFEVAGPDAAAFLNMVTSNYASWIEPGQSQYAYLLNHDGAIIDDIMIYRRSWENYLMVVNASNADKDWAWLNLVNDGKALIDSSWSCRAFEGKAAIRDLKAASSGADMRVDIALQGPASLRTLQKLCATPAMAKRVGAIRRTDLMETELGGINTVIARTGYTGEDVAFELFIHPDNAHRFWNMILEAGAEFGVKPCGLGARDSTRTEAGLPLYGHELEGHFGISPAGAGFASYVKLHKPYFVGREAFMAAEKNRTMEVLRFRITDKGVRMAKTGDAVANKRGVVMGHVTSCAMDLEGLQVGLAYCERKAITVNDPIAVFCSPGAPTDVAVGQQLKAGAKVILPVNAVILPRMRRGKKK
ncbi:MAG: glycine cleavage system aminomethyltransferase GcvT, partial [Myxococcota bacterium]